MHEEKIKTISLDLKNYKEIPVKTHIFNKCTEKEKFFEMVKNGLSHDILLKQFSSIFVDKYYMSAVRKCRPSRKQNP